MSGAPRGAPQFMHQPTLMQRRDLSASKPRSAGFSLATLVLDTLCDDGEGKLPFSGSPSHSVH